PPRLGAPRLARTLPAMGALATLAGLCLADAAQAQYTQQLAADPSTDDDAETTSEYYGIDTWEPDPSVVSPELVERRLEQLLGAAEMRFCHDSDYILHRGERSLCVFADDATERCPALLIACA